MRERPSRTMTDFQPQAMFPVCSDHSWDSLTSTVYKISNGDPYLQKYLQELQVKCFEGESLCLIATLETQTMQPIIFASPEVCSAFCEAFMTSQLYHRYYGAHQVNLQLLRSLARISLTDMVELDPDILSEADQEWEIGIISKVVKDLYLNSQTLKVENLTVSLKYKIIDEQSASYFKNIISAEVIASRVEKLIAGRCLLNDRGLSMLLEKGTLPIKSLKQIILRGNNLSDECFKCLKSLAAESQLQKIDVSNNMIKLVAELETWNRLSVLRNQSFPLLYSPKAISNPFLNLLFSLPGTLPMDIILDDNLVPSSACAFVVFYLIEAINVPIRYLSLRKNKFSEPDKIKMMKRYMDQLTVERQKERREELRGLAEGAPAADQIPLINFGRVCIIDSSIQKYQLRLLAEMARHGIPPEDPDSTDEQPDSPTLPIPRNEGGVKISRNRQWQICDPEDLNPNELGFGDMHRKTSFLIRSRASAESPNRSYSSDLQPVTPETLQSTISKLKNAYIQMNYPEICLCTELLREYNQEVYEVQIKPAMEKSHRILQEDKQSLVREAESVFNFSDVPEDELNLRLDALIVKMLRRRIGCHPQRDQLPVELEGEGDSSIMEVPALNFLLLLKSRRDQIIEESVNNSAAIAFSFIQKVRRVGNIYLNYYLPQGQKLDRLRQSDCFIGEDYPGLVAADVSSLWKLRNDMLASLENLEKWGQVEVWRLESLLRYAILEEVELQATTREAKQKPVLVRDKMVRNTQYLKRSLLQLKLNPTIFLKNYNRKYVQILKTLKVTLKSLPQKPCALPLLEEEDQLQFLAKYDIRNYPFSRTLVEKLKLNSQQISDYKGVKHPSYEDSMSQHYKQEMEQYCKQVQNFIIYLYHNTNQILRETVQYIEYIITTVANCKQEELRMALSEEFYLQLMSSTSAALSAGIMAIIFKYVSLYLPHTPLLQNYMYAFLLQAQPEYRNETVRGLAAVAFLRSGQPRINPQNSKVPKMMEYIFRNRSMNVPLKVYYSYQSAGERSQTAPKRAYYGVHFTIDIHMLSTLEQLYQAAMIKMPIPLRNCLERHWLFIYNRTTQNCKILLPSMAANVLELLDKKIVSLSSECQGIVTQLIIKPIMPDPCSLTLRSTIESSSSLNEQLSTRQHISFLLHEYLQLKYNFMSYGSVLSMIKPTERFRWQMEELIAESMLLELLVNCYQFFKTDECDGQHINDTFIELIRSYEQYLQLQQQQEPLISLLETIISFYEEIRMRDHIPRGVEAKLMGHNYTVIQELFTNKLCEVIRHLATIGFEDLNRNPEFLLMLQYRMTKFKRICGYVSECVELADGISQQLYFSTKGILYVKGLFNITPVQWHQIYYIDVTPKSIEIRYHKLSREEAEYGKVLTIHENHGTRLFMRALVVMVKKYCQLFVSQISMDQLYGFQGELAVLDNIKYCPGRTDTGTDLGTVLTVVSQKHVKNQIACRLFEEGINGDTNTLQHLHQMGRQSFEGKRTEQKDDEWFIRHLNEHIEYSGQFTNTQLNEYDYSESKEYQDSEQGYSYNLQEETDLDHINEGPLNISMGRRRSSAIQSVRRSNEQNGDKESEGNDKDSDNLTNKKPESERERSDISEDPIKASDIVISNVRRSGRRRTSSRKK